MGAPLTDTPQPPQEFEPRSENGEKVLFSTERKRSLQRKRLFFFVCLIMLNFSGPLSLISRLLRHGEPNWGAEIFHLICVVVIDLYMVPSVIFEVDSIEVNETGLVIKNLLWKSTPTFAEVKSFEVRQFFVWAILKTARCFYLINRRDIPNAEELIVLLDSRLPSSKTEV